MFKNTLLKSSINDLFTPKMLLYSLLPFILSMIVIYILFVMLGGIDMTHIGHLNIETTQTTIENGVPHTQSLSAQLEGFEIVKFLMEHSFSSGITSFFLYTLSGFFTLYISIFIAILVTGFLTPFVIKEIQRRHYQDIKMTGYTNIFATIFVTMKYSFIMIMLFFLLFPLYLIPYINIVAINLPLYYFFHKMMLFDIASNISTRKEAKEIYYFNKNSFRVKTFLLYLISLIPFTIFFASIFYLIYLGNSYFTELKKIRV